MSREKIRLPARLNCILTVVHKKSEGDIMTATNAQKVLESMVIMRD